MIEKIKEKITDDINKSDNSVNIFLNPYSYLLLRKNQSLLGYVDNVYIDGEWLCKFLKWFGIVKVLRRSFDNTSMAPVIFENLDSTTPLSVIGSDQVSNDKFCSLIEGKYPNIYINNKRNGYFNSSEEKLNIIDLIVESESKILICGMGTPLQEEFLVMLKENGWQGTSFTCGGFIHQSALKGQQYYPNWINRFNLRFAYRIWDEPKLVKRYTVDYFSFVVCFLFDYIVCKVD